MATVAASGHHRLRAWTVAVVVLLSTLFGTFPQASMVWLEPQPVCADVAVTVAVNPGSTLTAHLLDYRITAGHSHGPPAIINGSASNGHTYYVLAGNTPVLVHNCPPGSPARVSPAYQDWGTKGAHVHIGNHELRIFPDGNGGIGAAPITLRTGTATADDVASALNQIQTNPALRADLIRQAESAMASMNAGEWGMATNRAAEMHFLIVALKAMG